MMRPASISLTSACRSPAESFEVSTRKVVGAKRAVIFSSWASPGAEELVFGIRLLGRRGNGGKSERE